MKVNDIIKEIKSGKFKPVYVLHGEEGLFIDQITDALLNNAIQPHEKDFNLTVLYGKDTDAQTVMNACRRFPMMAERQVVLLKEAQFMRTLKDMSAYTSSIVPSTILIVNYKTKKIDSRTKFAKEAKKIGLVFNSEKIKEQHLPGWIDRSIKTAGYNPQPGVAQLLADYLGNDLSKVSKELEKLYLNISSKTISLADIEKNIGISKDYNAFELLNAIGARDKVKAYKIIKYFEQNPKAGPLPLVLASLFNHFNKIYHFHQLNKTNPSALRNELNIYNDYMLNRVKNDASKFKPAQLENIFSLLQRCDLESKGVGASGKSAGSIYKELVFNILNV